MKADIMPINLSSLKKYQSAIVSEIVANPIFGDMDELVSRRLQDLGFLPGARVKVSAKMPIGSPIAVQIAGGSQFSLRAEEADKIKCRLI